MAKRWLHVVELIRETVDGPGRKLGRRWTGDWHCNAFGHADTSHELALGSPLSGEETGESKLWVKCIRETKLDKA